MGSPAATNQSLIILSRLPIIKKKEMKSKIINAFISLEISSQLFIFFSLFSFILAWTFISLQIKEFRIMGLSINDSVYSSLFFFLTGLHFFHLLVGLFLLSLFFWGYGFPAKILYFVNLRV